jgi:hypothetical protein
MATDVSRKQKERIALARRIENTGFDMAPCSSCEKEGRKCVMDTALSSRCAECVRRKRSCDGLSDAWTKNVPSQNDWMAIERQENALEEQEERAAAAAQEAMARVARLRKQRQLLKNRKLEMSRRGLKYLEELDAAEEAAIRENEARVIEKSPPLITDSVDLSQVLGVSDFDPSFWATVDFGGGMPQASQGS